MKRIRRLQQYSITTSSAAGFVPGAAKTVRGRLSASIADNSRSATALARERSELIGFFHSDLIEITNIHPAMGAKISLGLAKTLAERLRFTNSQLRNMWEIRGLDERGNNAP